MGIYRCIIRGVPNGGFRFQIVVYICYIYSYINLAPRAACVVPHICVGEGSKIGFFILLVSIHL